MRRFRAIPFITGWTIRRTRSRSGSGFPWLWRGVIRVMWFRDPVGEDRRPIVVPPALGAAIALTTATVVAVGVYPELFARVGDLATRFVS